MNKKRGLIVDNNFDMANFLEIVLGLAGLECETVYSPQAALDFLASNEPDLIFLDLNLKSSAQGSDLLYQIRSNPHFDHTRVIIITEQPSLTQPVHSLADLVLINPVENEQLSRLTSRLLMMEIKPYEFRDPLTGLYNLKFFNTRLELAVDRSRRRPDNIFAALAIELKEADEDKTVSESEWEQVLKTLVERWLARFRPTNVFGRLGRRQVLGLFEDLKHPMDVQVIIDRMMEELAHPVELDGRLVKLAGCTGAVVSQKSYARVENVLEGVMQALERARYAEGMRHIEVETVHRPAESWLVSRA